MEIERLVLCESTSHSAAAKQQQQRHYLAFTCKQFAPRRRWIRLLDSIVIVDVLMLPISSGER